jgi:hypothetical protein
MMSTNPIGDPKSEERLPAPIQVEHFTSALYMLLDETFDNVQGYFLDKGTSLFETLATISADEASIPVGGQCATLAAQVKHVAFYLDVVEKNMRSGSFQRVDWGEIWRTTREVTPGEWEEIKAKLRDSYDHLKALIGEVQDWPDETQVGIAIATIVHTAYHLGEIRQALCTIKS